MIWAGRPSTNIEQVVQDVGDALRRRQRPENHHQRARDILTPQVVLVLFFIGALGAHIRARAFCNVAFPGLYLLLAMAATTYMIRVAA